MVDDGTLTRIENIKTLARLYFTMKAKELIEKPDERLRIVDIRSDNKSKKHPHEGHRVYIKRRAIKHIVESRKEELLKNHDDAYALISIITIKGSGDLLYSF